MPEYRRAFAPGATFFFTVATGYRRPIFAIPSAVNLLREAFRREREHHPFEIDAIVILPDHLHCLWTLPPGDSRFSMRWSAVKGGFTRSFLASGGREGRRDASHSKRNERAVWQRRFWEHVIKGDDDYARHMDYIHYIPVKHGLTSCPHSWPYTSFDKWVREGSYARDWCCACDGEIVRPPDFDAIAKTVGE